MWRPLAAARTVRWKPYGNDGLEHLVIEPRPGRIEVRAVVIGEREGVAYGARWRCLCDADWRVREFGITTADNRGLALVSPEPGRWVDAAGDALSQLDGCLDIDLSASPFTNTLPIRRLGLEPEHGSVALEMVWIPFDTLRPQRDGQIYTCLEANRRFRFDAADGSFTAEITTDEDGLVTDYPPLFRRA
jgi:uncharacterized protein